MNPSQISISIAFLAGLVSFLSPCVLPLVPIYLAQLVGQSVYQATEAREEFSTRLITFLHAATFVCGFTLAFVALGATASTLGGFLSANQVLLRRVGGVILVILGMHLSGVLKIQMLYQQRRFEFHPERPGYAASLLMGIIFAIAWTPCIGPIAGAVLAMAASVATLKIGVMLLFAYSLGLGVPFLLLGLGLNQFSRLLRALRPHLGKIEIGTGILMIVLGVVVFFNMLIYLNQYFNFGISI